MAAIASVCALFPSVSENDRNSASTAISNAIRRLKIRCNAETPVDAGTARRFAAEGIGLSRTEHMFFEADRIGAMRRVIMAEDETGRRAGLAELLPIQREDFAEIFRIMKGFP